MNDSRSHSDSDASRPLSVALVDDDDGFARDMRAALARCFSAAGEKHVFTAYPDAETFWTERLSLRPDIVLLDIQLPQENGIALAKKLYRTDKRPALVFVTASPDFAVHGYGVNALGYLVKPVADHALADILAAARERLRPAAAALAVRDANAKGMRLLPLASIISMESRNRRVLFHCDGDVVECGGSLGDFQPRLPRTFLQVHKSFIINLDRAVALRKTGVVLDDGTEAPISRRFGKQTAEAFFARLDSETEDEP